MCPSCLQRIFVSHYLLEVKPVSSAKEPYISRIFRKRNLYLPQKSLTYLPQKSLTYVRQKSLTYFVSHYLLEVKPVSSAKEPYISHKRAPHQHSRAHRCPNWLQPEFFWFPLSPVKEPYISCKSPIYPAKRPTLTSTCSRLIAAGFFFVACKIYSERNPNLLHKSTIYPAKRPTLIFACSQLCTAGIFCVVQNLLGIVSSQYPLKKSPISPAKEPCISPRTPHIFQKSRICLAKETCISRRGPHFIQKSPTPTLICSQVSELITAGFFLISTISCKRALYLLQKSPIYSAKRPTYHSKEPHTHVDLLTGARVDHCGIHRFVCFINIEWFVCVL